MMEYLNLEAAATAGHLNRHNFGLEYTVEEYPREHRHELRQALIEAWMWLEREGLLIPKPGTRRRLDGDLAPRPTNAEAQGRGCVPGGKPISSATAASENREKRMAAVSPGGLRYRRVPGIQGGRSQGERGGTVHGRRVRNPPDEKGPSTRTTAPLPTRQRPKAKGMLSATYSPGRSAATKTPTAIAT